MQHHIDNKIYHIEILAPKQNTEKLDEDLATFAEKYNAVIEAGYAACITDNPMGLLSFHATDIIPELGLPVKPEQLIIHLNTFHTKTGMDQILDAAARMGAKYLLVVSGDGGERLPRLDPKAIGEHGHVVTSIELLRYIHKRHPGVFTCGVVFNPYEPQDHELAKMRRKMDAGAKFICTQPVIGKDERVYALRIFGQPIIIGTWMSKNIQLLSDCVGYTIPKNTHYDPMENLRQLRTHYPDCGLYLSLLGFKTQFPLLRAIWGRAA